MEDSTRRRVTARPSGAAHASAPGAAGADVLSSGGLLALQRSAGNAAVVRMLKEARRRDGASGGSGSGDDGGPAVQRSAGRDPAIRRHPLVHDVLRSPGQPLDGRVREDMEARFGVDFSDVRVHTGAEAQASAADIGARAYTSGHHVVIGKGGADPHTLAHELTHVVQQRRGPVAGTDQGDGMRVSDPSDRFEREAEATARSVMRRPVRPVRTDSGPQQEQEPEPVRSVPTATAPGTPAVQRKGPDALASQVALPQPKKGFAAFLKKDPPSRVAAIHQMLERYDASPVRGPEQCMVPLAGIQIAVHTLADQGELSEEERAYLDETKNVVARELEILGEQVEKDTALPAGARPPYDAMTDRGALWNDREFPAGAGKFGMAGYSYFRELSDLNRASLSREIGPRADDAWVQKVTSDLESELRKGVLTHYTTEASYKAMVKGGNALKSKSELDKANPGQRNNTSDYDTVALGNEGFTFFYLEPAGSPLRDSRFARPEDPRDNSARITLNVSDTAMETEGWAMLSDFAQREYPVLKAHPDRPAETESFLPGREQRDLEKTLDVRRFDRAVVSQDQLVEIIEEFQEISDSGERQARSRSRQDAVTDSEHRMVYGSGSGEVKYPELLHSNVLVGPDIIKGLAQRAVVEIMRIEAVNVALADRMKAMAPAELARFLLKDLLRAQIMLPNQTLLDTAEIDVYNAADLFGEPQA